MMHGFALSTIEPDGITNGKYYWVHLLCWKMGQEDFKYLTKSHYKWMFMCKPLSHSTFTKYSLSTQSLNSSNSSTTQTNLALPSKCRKGVKPLILHSLQWEELRSIFRQPFFVVEVNKSYLKVEYFYYKFLDNCSIILSASVSLFILNPYNLTQFQVKPLPGVYNSYRVELHFYLVATNLYQDALQVQQLPTVAIQDTTLCSLLVTCRQSEYFQSAFSKVTTGASAITAPNI